jgi:hypothetical protein
MDEKLEEEPGSGFWLCIAQRNAREVMVEVSERCYRRHRPIGAGSPYSPPARYEMSWEIFPKYE